MEFHNKIAHSGTISPPHQDNFYHCYDPPDALTAYIPLAVHDKKNGCLQFVPGSHIGPLREHFYSDTKAFSSYCNADEKFEFAVIKPGDIIFHHTKMVHKADANNSDRDRPSVAIRITGVKARKSKKMLNIYESFLKKNRK